MTGLSEATLARLQLAEALCARICHDLSSPLGTLMGALEMVAEDPGALEDAMPIASETAAAMTARLRLLRAAWGGDCGPLSVAQLAELARGVPPRVRVDLQGLGQARFQSPLARAILNLLLLGVEALPRGGVLSVTQEAGGAVRFAPSGQGASWPPTLDQALQDPLSVTLDNPRAVQAPLAVLMAQAAGASLALSPSPDAQALPTLLLSVS